MPIARAADDHYQLLQQLIDQRDVERMLTAYAAAVDGRDWDTYEGLFTADADIDYREGFGPSGKPREVREWMEANLTRPRLSVCQHLTANVAVTVVDDRAKARADFFNPDIESDESGDQRLRLNAGTYWLSAVRTTNGWKIAELTARLHWSYWTGGASLQVPRWVDES